MKYCEHCGGKLEGEVTYCPNCGASIDKKEEKEVVTATDGTVNTTVKDNTTVAFVCSIIGALCCTYVAIPGLILSIQSLNQMKEGKISSEKKWMAIVGIVLSAIGLIQMVYNFIHPNQDVVNKVNELLNQ